jgi:hypothetical protein
MPSSYSDIVQDVPVVVVDAFGQRLHRRAASAVVEGHDFPVVWLCQEDEWASARKEGRVPRATPWPAEDVTASP